ncbi:MAG: TonB-dependent receptor [Saprospiraceae bacterium]
MSQKNIFYPFIVLLCLFGGTLFGQQTLTGTTTDETGETLPFVNVVIESLSIGTTSDLDGNYTFEVPNQENLEITFSFIGYASQTIPYTGQSTLNVILGEDTNLLDEVVVVGYGTQKKSDITGAVSIIKVEDAKKVPSTNIAELLRGKSPGVQVTLTDPSPGGSSSIVIRGISSFGGSDANKPLFVVDGVPQEDINGINSEDIKSMEILKDASSQAIYGARAANGVVLITTKRGKKGELKIAYHGYRSTQKLVRNFDLYSGDEWVQLRREAYRSESGRLNEDGWEEYEPDDFVFTPFQLDVLGTGKYINWEDEVINDATQQSHSVSLSTGSDKTSLFSSFSFFDQNGIIPKSGYARGTARLNLDHKVNDKFTFGTNIYLTADKTDRRSGSLNFITLPPLAKVFDDNGDVIRYPTGEIEKTSPLWNINESTNEFFTNRFQMTVFAQYEIFKNFKYKLNTSITRKSGQGGTYQTRLHSSATGVLGKATLSGSIDKDFLIENIFDYNLDINDNNRMDFTFVQGISKGSKEFSKTTATEFPNDLLGYNGIASAANILPVERRVVERQLLSFMGRMRYYFNDKYLLTLTARRDGASVFSENDKWGVFPSVAVAWKAHLEPFIQNLEFVDELKLRISHGSVGNQAIAPYTTLGLASAENYLFEGAVGGGYSPGRSLFNPDLKWETSTTSNFGVDFGLFKNFLVGNVEVYKASTTDLLINRTTPGSTGYSDILVNIGEVENSGVEVGLTANVIKKKNFEWSLSSTFSANSNKIIKLSDEVDENGNYLDDLSRRRFIGHPISVIFDYKYDGIWNSQEEIDGSHMPDSRPGDIRVQDINSDGKIDAEDRVIIHKDPDWYGSLGTNVSFGGFDLYAELYHVAGAIKYNNYLAGFNEGGSLQGVLNGIKVDYWTPENQTGTYPRPRRNEFPSNLGTTAISDATYTRLRTVSLAYHLPDIITKRLKLSDVTIYGTATNLVTWTDFLSYSPETTVGAYPDGKNFLFGIKITN